MSDTHRSSRLVPAERQRRPLVVAVCGGRSYEDRERVAAVLDWVGPIERLVHGGAEGADALGALWAAARGVPTHAFLADWKTYGLGAGPRRNQQMIDEGQARLIVAFPGGRGTADMVRRARKARVPVLLIDGGPRDACRYEPEERRRPGR